MSTATMEPPASLAALMAAAAVAPVKAKSKTPCVHIPALASLGAEYFAARRARVDSAARMIETELKAFEAPNAPPITLQYEYAKLCSDVTDAEARKAAAAAVIMAAARPHLRDLSKRAGAPASSLRVNGCLMISSASQSDLRDTADNPHVVAAAMNGFGSEFFKYFAPVVKTQMSPDEIMAINAFLDSVGAPCPRVTYSLDWKPTPALHAARMLNPAVEAQCQEFTPQIRPVQYVKAT